ncbi:KAP family P-loop NTPase fold protein [Sphingobium sp. CR28]|uniref:KAP family P-loop NTPase fold protein n=1 Tax=Sphingobium sp. CR28 TaxID=3400272 RepID=UPI003FEFCBBC
MTASESDPLGKIWEGDMLRRQSEARVLERFLRSESEALADQGREQAVVLALDSKYGEGKSWFLDRFRRQLGLNHPVAFVDAWIDDANQEPLVSIMAALDDALQPFLASKTISRKMAELTRAALPIMGKAVVGLGGKLVARHIGDQFSGEAGELVRDLGENLAEDVSEMVDTAGRALLDQYRARQKSREKFKGSLRQLATSISSASDDSRTSPIFVIIDELDRCRPSYAIGILEEIKHLFDVPGVVFIIALHGSQLAESVKAVYGAGFNAADYLRRFFTRHYELRRLSIKELVVKYFAWIPFTEITFCSPPLWADGRSVEANQVELAGELLTDWGATPREALAVLDGLRLFVVGWELKVPIELPLVLVMLLNATRGNANETAPPRETSDGPIFALPTNDQRTSVFKAARASDLTGPYNTGMSTPLPQIAKNNYSHGALGYVGDRLGDEFAIRFNRSTPRGSPAQMSSWSEYQDRLKRVGRFLDKIEKSGG